jgi:AraC family transcriptional regulator of arabinose operon
VLNICPDHCIRLFREQVNKTPMRYLADLRLTEAMKRLVETDLSVGSIAAECGYSSAAHLTKTFKDRLGITPREYRCRTQD